MSVLRQNGQNVRWPRGAAAMLLLCDKQGIDRQTDRRQTDALRFFAMGAASVLNETTDKHKGLFTAQELN